MWDFVKVFRKRRIQKTTQLELQSSIASFYDVDTAYVYQQSDIVPLNEGVSYTFHGLTQLDCERFSVNFLLPYNDDIALHINPRLPQNYIVRNSKVKDVWGREENASPLPFNLRRGNRFTLQVLVTEACFMISINGRHFAEYAHRLPYRKITNIQVKGDVTDITVKRSIVDHYPEQALAMKPHDVVYVDDEIPASSPFVAAKMAKMTANRDEIDAKLVTTKVAIISSASMNWSSLNKTTSKELQLPYYGQLPQNSLLNGRALRIDGRIKLLPHSFYINLQNSRDIWPHPLISFHFNPRFSKQSGTLGKAIVCRNAWHDGQWAKEECSELDTDLRPGKEFTLVILCTDDHFEVYVNRKFLLEFKYKIEPNLTDVIYIQGDIKLWNVLLEKNRLLSDGRSHVYENRALDLSTY